MASSVPTVGRPFPFFGSNFRAVLVRDLGVDDAQPDVMVYVSNFNFFSRSVRAECVCEQVQFFCTRCDGAGSLAVEKGFCIFIDVNTSVCQLANSHRHTKDEYRQQRLDWVRMTWEHYSKK